MARIRNNFQWIVNSLSSHIDFGLQANFLLFLGFAECGGADRLVLVVNDECLRDSALRGGLCLAFFKFRCTSQLKWPIFKMSTTSQCFSAVFVANIVMGILKIL